MNLKTRINLWKLKRKMGPTRAFKASLCKDLAVSWDAKYGKKLPWYQIGMRHAAAGFAIITLVLTGAGGVYAYNSSEVTEGALLYPIKQVLETVEEVAKITPEAKAKFYIKKIERREAERQVLERKNLLPKIKKEIRETEEVGSEIEINTFSSDLKVEVKEKIKTEVIERKIKRTKKSIEKTEEQLEKTRQIIEKSQSKDIKLREELKRRAEQRLEEAKKQLEIKVEQQKERRENLKEIIQNRDNNKIEERSRIRAEGLINLNN